MCCVFLLCNCFSYICGLYKSTRRLLNLKCSKSKCRFSLYGTNILPKKRKTDVLEEWLTQKSKTVYFFNESRLPGNNLSFLCSADHAYFPSSLGHTLSWLSMFVTVEKCSRQRPLSKLLGTHQRSAQHQRSEIRVSLGKASFPLLIYEQLQQRAAGNKPTEDRFMVYGFGGEGAALCLHWLVFRYPTLNQAES